MTAADLSRKRCLPCEGGVPTLSEVEAVALLGSLAGWTILEGGQRIRRTWRAKNFAAAMTFLDAVAEVAEAEQHHPDLHLVAYRDLTIELTTHAIGGLSENDFILAAKIDAFPSPEKKKADG